jgi:hypothetical protein
LIFILEEGVVWMCTVANTSEERAASFFRTRKNAFSIRVFDVRKAGFVLGVLASKWEQVGGLKGVLLMR